MKLSQLLGAEVVLKDKKKRGYVLGVTCAENAIDSYICCDECENEFYLDGETAKFADGKLKSVQTVKKRKKLSNIKLGYPLYSENGKFLGYISDFTVKGNQILYAHCGNRKYNFLHITLGDVAILKNQKPLAEIAAKDMFIGAICNG